MMVAQASLTALLGRSGLVKVLGLWVGRVLSPLFLVLRSWEVEQGRLGNARVDRFGRRMYL